MKARNMGTVVWLTGLSGAGKSTVAASLERYVTGLGLRAYVLDGDKLRAGLCSDLGFSDSDRQENMRRAGEAARMLVDAGVIVIAALISPFSSDRAGVRQRFGAGEFHEVYCACPLAVCERRDVKGLYRAARAGRIPLFTGITSPYEAPTDADLLLHTAVETVEQSTMRLIAFLRERGALTTAIDDDALAA